VVKPLAMARWRLARSLLAASAVAPSPRIEIEIVAISGAVRIVADPLTVMPWGTTSRDCAKAGMGAATSKANNMGKRIGSLLE
jgi:hypothetical protein